MRSHKFKKLLGTEPFWTFRCRFAWQAQGIVHLVKSFVAVSTTTTPLSHYTTLHSNALHHAHFHYTLCICEYNYNYTTLHTAHDATLHNTNYSYNCNYSHNYNNNYITLHYTNITITTACHYSTLRYTTLITLHYTLQHTRLH